MDELERVLAALPHLPIFPLPGAVLLPHGAMPLHIFEPRYRQMTRDCLPRHGGKNALAPAPIVPPPLRAAADPPRAESTPRAPPLPPPPSPPPRPPHPR